jgi:predicted SprT family Zn-dependent metalloprotease
MNHMPPKVVAMITRALAAIAAKSPQWAEVANKITFEVNTRARRWFGKACLRRNVIEMNHDYMLNAKDESIYDTITHEYAHFIAFVIYKDRGHGRMWKYVHRSLGGLAKACKGFEEHGFTVKRNNVKRVTLERDGKIHKITLARWNRQKSGLLASRFKYVNTVLVDRNTGTETIIHRYSPVAPQVCLTITSARPGVGTYQVNLTAS